MTYSIEYKMKYSRKQEGLEKQITTINTQGC